jgi:hypothetical protein
MKKAFQRLWHGLKLREANHRLGCWAKTQGSQSQAGLLGKNSGKPITGWAAGQKLREANHRLGCGQKLREANHRLGCWAKTQGSQPKAGYLIPHTSCLATSI